MGKTSPDHSGQISIDYSLTSFLFILFCVHSVFSFLWPLLQTLLLLYLFILFCFQSVLSSPSTATLLTTLTLLYFLFYFVSIQFDPFSDPLYAHYLFKFLIYLLFILFCFHSVLSFLCPFYAHYLNKFLISQVFILFCFLSVFCPFFAPLCPLS